MLLRSRIANRSVANRVDWQHHTEGSEGTRVLCLPTTFRTISKTAYHGVDYGHLLALIEPGDFDVKNGHFSMAVPRKRIACGRGRCRWNLRLTTPTTYNSTAAYHSSTAVSESIKRSNTPTCLDTAKHTFMTNGKQRSNPEEDESTFLCGSRDPP